MPVDDTLLGPGLYLVVCWRDVGFHWMIYSYDGGVARWAFHAINQGVNGWMFERRNWNPVSSALALSALRIGVYVPAVEGLLAPIPMVTPAIDQQQGAFTCRIWVRQAIRTLHSANLIVCPDVDALEAEGVQVGNFHRQGVAFLGQPGQVYTSQHSH
ncbi:hypothetical protein CALVIDRAFT_569902 [Calocera viscosa TUFC12733]|uniref:Uncharacterized protein n=1 Tax=Calocera viscosa (strain TUFC12733) TaxID=1330018 RepID=A0A167FGG1_CALVF|nr:hypothetical protein CALVIDRAFT_569902 [Calocera viscosa TUFC12733]